MQCMPCSSQIISEMLPEIHTMENLILSNLGLFGQTLNPFLNAYIAFYTEHTPSCYLFYSPVCHYLGDMEYFL